MSWRKHELEIALKYPNVDYYRLPIDNLHPIRQGDAPRYTFPFFDAQSIHHTWKFHLNTGTPPASDGKSVGGHRFPDAERSPALRCPKDVGCMGVWDLLNLFFSFTSQKSGTVRTCKWDATSIADQPFVHFTRLAGNRANTTPQRRCNYKVLVPGPTHGHQHLSCPKEHDARQSAELASSGSEKRIELIPRKAAVGIPSQLRYEIVWLFCHIRKGLWWVLVSREPGMNECAEPALAVPIRVR